ncbi:hypothetical protein AB0425_17740 [Actinosynnema sp. NPDC051121]
MPESDSSPATRTDVIAERTGRYALIIGVTDAGTVDVIVQAVDDAGAARWLRKAANRLEARAAAHGDHVADNLDH